MPFKPGQSGNPSGAKPRPFRDALLMEFAEANLDDPTPVKHGSIRHVARTLIQKAVMQEDTASIKEIADRIDGKVPQAVTGEDGEGPLTIQIVRLVTNGSDPAP